MHNELTYRFSYKLISIFLFLSCFGIKKTYAQVWELGGGLGLSNYQGELTSSNFDNGVDIYFDPAIVIFAKKYFNPYLNSNFNLMYTGLRGDDGLSSAARTRARNLDFESSIFQASGRLEFNILGFEPGDFNRRISPFVTAGFSVFRFNPVTTFNGQKLPLQPLGTEGQGLSILSGFEKYNRISFNIPMGGGIKYNITENLALTIEMIFHYTFTDFIDDVSTNYVNYNVLLAERGPLTAALANRTGEFLMSEPVLLPTGQRRGNSEVNDHWLTGLVSIGYRFDPTHSKRVSGKKVQCPKF